MPIDLLGMDRASGETLERALEEEVVKQPENQLADRQAVRAALPAEEAERSACLEEEACLIEVGEKVDADLVLSLRMAGLGETHVIRARLFDVDRAILVKDLQETGGGDTELPDHARAVSHRLFPPPAKRSRWWLWAIGAAAVATTTTILIVAGEDQTGIIHVGDL